MSRDEGKRFRKIYSEGSGLSSEDVILQDTATGVLYYFRATSSGAGLTPLLGPDGRPLVELVG